MCWTWFFLGRKWGRETLPITKRATGGAEIIVSCCLLSFPLAGSRHGTRQAEFGHYFLTFPAPNGAESQYIRYFDALVNPVNPKSVTGEAQGLPSLGFRQMLSFLVRDARGVSEFQFPDQLWNPARHN